MARIKSLGSSLTTLDSAVKPLPKETLPFYLSPEWRALVAQLIRERGSHCEYCPRRGCRVVGDHVKEVKDGGAPLDPSNVKLSCWPCHTTKTNKERAKRIVAPLTDGRGV